jgi:predicted RNA-binding protein with PUA-like domain
LKPGLLSWEDYKKGDKGEGWNGIRNYQASNNIKNMELGDLFFYYSVNKKSIFGIQKIIEEYQPDQTDNTDPFGIVVIKA